MPDTGAKLPADDLARKLVHVRTDRLTHIGVVGDTDTILLGERYGRQVLPDQRAKERNGSKLPTRVAKYKTEMLDHA